MKPESLEPSIKRLAPLAVPISMEYILGLTTEAELGEGICLDYLIVKLEAV
jgi:hypothetical protein